MCVYLSKWQNDQLVSQTQESTIQPSTCLNKTTRNHNVMLKMVSDRKGLEKLNRMWRCTPLTPTLGRLKEVDLLAPGHRAENAIHSSLCIKVVYFIVVSVWLPASTWLGACGGQRTVFLVLPFYFLHGLRSLDFCQPWKTIFERIQVTG